MASASGSGQAAFGLGRRKKNPGLLDQIGKFFGGDKKRKAKVRKRTEPGGLSARGGARPTNVCSLFGFQSGLEWRIAGSQLVSSSCLCGFSSFLVFPSPVSPLHTC